VHTVEQLVDMDFSNILTVLAIAASPVSELRGAIPVAVSVYNFPWYHAFLIGVIGNIIPVPFILLFLNAIVRQLSRIHFLERFMRWFLEHARRRGQLIERSEGAGLVLFVSVPLPVTGAWTGSIIAVLLGLRFRYALLSIIAGILIAGIIVTSATMLGWTLFGLIKID